MAYRVFIKPNSSDSRNGPWYYLQDGGYKLIPSFPGRNGANGKDGQNGANGANGANGIDGTLPSYAFVTGEGNQPITATLEPVKLINNISIKQDIGTGWSLNGGVNVVIDKPTKYEITYSVIVEMKTDNFNPVSTTVNTEIGVRAAGSAGPYAIISGSDTSMTYTYNDFDNQGVRQITKTFITTFAAGQEVALRISSTTTGFNSIIGNTAQLFTEYGDITPASILFRSIDT